MKQRTTTAQNFKSWAKKVALVVCSALIITAVPMQLTQKASADQYDQKISALQQDINRYQAETARLNAQAASVQNTLAQLANNMAAIQAQININQVKYDQLVKQITDTEVKIKQNQDALGTILAQIYVDDKITPIEILASSKSVSDFIDKQEYRSSIRTQLTSTIGDIKSLKKKLETDKTAVGKILDNQKSQRAILAAKQNEQQTILSQTQGQSSNYQQMIANRQSEIAQIRAVQAALNARINGSGGYTLIDSGLLGAYPWNNLNCPMSYYFSTGGADGNGSDGHGYGCRQCASYVAWRIAKETGRYYTNWGNANNFPASARAAGYRTGSTPRAGSVAVMYAGAYGHVAWVEAVPGNGTIVISQYNWDYGAGYGMYSQMVVSQSVFQEYIYIL